MNEKKLVDVLYSPISTEWKNEIETALNVFISTRYGKNVNKDFQVRINGDTKEDRAPFAAIIPAGQPSSGPYGGMSFVLFPSADKDVPALVSFVVGTNGLSPDEHVLSRPGHARKLMAVSKWILEKSSNEALVWAKDDPVRIDRDIPKNINDKLIKSYNNAIKKYGTFLYFIYVPTNNKDQTDEIIIALFDIFTGERGVMPLKNFKIQYDDLKSQWLKKIFKQVTIEEIKNILDMRRFLILEGPPGTGKTRMAKQVLEEYDNNGTIIQFHPSTTYETFIGGLAPEVSKNDIGLLFKPKRGYLMDAVLKAQKCPNKKYILIIDEINRADLAKVLGEGLFLFEPQEMDRKIELPFEFDEIGRTLSIPGNLYILGTMNSADRSTAIMDLAVRRRFGFVQMWPDKNALSSSSKNMQKAFDDLFLLFLEEAGQDAFELMPGHSYFMDEGKNQIERTQMIQTGLVPLLLEYVKQDYVGGFCDQLKAYIDNIAAYTE